VHGLGAHSFAAGAHIFGEQGEVSVELAGELGASDF